MSTRFFACTIVLFPLILIGCQRPLSEKPEKGVTFELNKTRKSLYDSLAYDITLWIPEKRTDSIRGEIKIQFQLSNRKSPVILDFSQPAKMVQGVRYKGEELKYEVENGHILLPARRWDSGLNEIEISFTAGDLSLNRNEAYLYTLLVPDRASTCFPLIDQPNIKARYTLTLHTPVGWEAVANGKLVEKRELKDNWYYRFAPTQPISSYLFAFATGKFSKRNKKIGGREFSMYYRETDHVKVDRNADSIFEMHAHALDWLEEYTGIAYPFGKFDIALIPSFQYGGMEHPGAVFYNESALFLDENATINKRLARANVIAHESAHMWFGDLVTMDWFNDVWLKEVFANFMAAKIVHPTFPEMNHRLRFLLAHYPAAYDVDRTLGANAIIQELDNLNNAGSLYGAIIYHKAPVVMRQLEMKIGEKLLRESLQDYLKLYQFDNAKWDDLIKIIDEKTPLDMKSWSDTWVKSAGMPSYELVMKDTLCSYAQLPDQKEGRIWLQPLQLTLAVGDSVHTLTPDSNTGNNAQWTASSGLSVFPNPDGVAYGYFSMDTLSVQTFLSNYQQYADPVFRGSQLVNIWEGFLQGDGGKPPVLLARLLGVLPKESNSLLVDYLLGRISSIYWKFLTEEQRQYFQPQVETLLWKQLLITKDLGLKNTFFKSYKSMAYSPEAQEKLKSLWLDSLRIEGLSLSEEDKISLAHQLALYNPEQSQQILNDQRAKVLNPDRKGKMTFMMPVFSADQTVRDSFFDSLKLPENREKESWVLEALHFLHHPLKQFNSIKYLKPSMDLLQEIQRTGDIFFPTRWMDHSFGGHSSPEAAAIARQFIKNHPDYPVFLRDKIFQATDLLERAVQLKSAQ
ncbi:M1 family aminopeptidase [Dyadobacter tibetensis]|uniref:M1 family aminopeptidase n=1 Tax=Dyadobacter tibetensis TaxID=1211851 RepID=UPI000470805F|nr:M1 family aminopeptidase [Dyadobacter tibetensis]